MHNGGGAPHRRRAILLTGLTMLLAGCSAAASPSAVLSPSALPHPSASLPTPTPAAAATLTPTASPGPSAGRPPTLPVATPPLAWVPPSSVSVVGEAPETVVAAARADLAGRLPAQAAAGAVIVRSEAVAWPDGSLGCPIPGELYPQVITPGYRIVLAVDGAEYDYRATETGVVRLCDHALAPNPGG